MADEPVPTAGPPSPPSTAASPRRSSAPITALILLSGFGAVVFVASVVASMYLLVWESPGTVGQGSYLTVMLDSDTSEVPTPKGLGLDPEAFPPVTSEIAAALRRAGSDDRIDGVLLRLDSPGVGWGGAQEIRSSIVSFRESGKPCVAYAEAYSTLGYYVASACDKVVMAPAGIGMVLGLSATTTYYRGTLDLLGVEAEFEHVGDFKTAVEPYERVEPSEASVAATNSLLDSLWGQWTADVSSGRGVGAEAVLDWVSRPAMSPRQALERGLVDALAYPDQVRARMPDVADEAWASLLGEPPAEGAGEVELTALGEFIKDLRIEWAEPRRYVAVMHLGGPIVSGESGGGLFGQQVVADRTFAEWMKEARDDDAVAGVVLRVDSPGGSGLASDVMWRQIKRFQATGRPVVVTMADAAASGGYYISAPADWVVAQPGTITGSIGVFGGKMNLAGAYEKIGMTQATFERGDEADLFSSTSSFSEVGRDAYRGFLQDFYDLFLERVSIGREMPVDTVHEVAQGRVWTGTQALERGLVDELGGMDRALAKVAEITGESDLGLQRWPRRKGFLDLLMEDLQGTRATTVHLSVGDVPLVDSEPLVELFVLEHVLSNGGVAAMLPGALRVR